MATPSANILFCCFVLDIFLLLLLLPPQEVTAADIIQQGAFMGTTAAFYSH